MSHHRAYRIWWGMLQRCRNSNRREFEQYGGRGIRVCPGWGLFENFWRDVGLTYLDGRELDRIDTNGNYEPGNCRWTTRRTQVRNKRKAEGTSSRFIGVHRVGHKFRAVIRAGEIQPDGRAKAIHLGYFASDIEAAHAYDEAALEYFGKEATLNFPPNKVDSTRLLC